MNAQNLKIVCLGMALSLSGLFVQAQDKPATNPGKQKPKESTTTVVLKITKDENGNITTIDTSYTAENLPDSTDLAFAKTFRFDENGMADLEVNIAKMMNNLKLDSLEPLMQHLGISHDFSKGQTHPDHHGYCYSYKWNDHQADTEDDQDEQACNCPYCVAMRSLSKVSVPGYFSNIFDEATQGKTIKIISRRNGKKIIIKVANNGEYSYTLPSSRRSSGKTSRVIILDSNGRTREL